MVFRSPQGVTAKTSSHLVSFVHPPLTGRGFQAAQSLYNERFASAHPSLTVHKVPHEPRRL